MNKEIKQFLNRIRLVAISLILRGIVFILVGELYVKPLTSLWGTVISHIGIAIMIAGIINLILELTEMKSFFEERLLSIVASDDFLDLLSEPILSDYIFNAMHRLLRNKAPSDYRDYGGIVRTITRDILPALGGIYCEDYNDSTEFKLLKSDEIEILKLNQDIHAAKITNRVSYDFIAPNQDEELEISVKYYYGVKEINSFPINDQFNLRLFLTHKDQDEKEEKVDLEKYLKNEEGFISLDLSYETKFKTFLRCRIECTIVSSPPPTLRLVYMKYPTRNVTVHFSSNVPLMPTGEVYGIAPDYTEPFETDHALTLRYPGWMLEDQGYFIKWDAEWLCK